MMIMVAIIIVKLFGSVVFQLVSFCSLFIFFMAHHWMKGGKERKRETKEGGEKETGK